MARSLALKLALSTAIFGTVNLASLEASHSQPRLGLSEEDCNIVESYEQERGSFLDAFEDMIKSQSTCGLGTKSENEQKCEQVAFSRRLNDFEVTIGILGSDVSEADLVNFRDMVSIELNKYTAWTQVKPQFILPGGQLSTPRRVDILIFDPQIFVEQGPKFIRENISFPDFMFSEERAALFSDFMNSGESCLAFNVSTSDGELIHSHVWVRGDSFSIKTGIGSLGQLCAKQVPFIAFGLNIQKSARLLERTGYTDVEWYQKSVALQRVVLEIFYSNIVSSGDEISDVRSKVASAVEKECGIDF